jgi:hypothetical protein
VPENFEYDELRKSIQLVIQVNRQEGTGLGLRIAGGKGSTPFREDDDVCIRIDSFIYIGIY